MLSSSNGVGVSDSPVEPGVAPQLEGTAPSSNVTLAERAPLPLLSDYENSVLRALSERIRDKLKSKDLVFFVGNSGRLVVSERKIARFSCSHCAPSYLLYPFDQTSYNVNSLPMSKSRIYGTNEDGGKGKANNRGLDGYWQRVLEPRLTRAEFNRIVIVDHSGTGKSVDGLRKAFKEIVNRAKDTKQIRGSDAKKYLDTPWHLINVVDWNRRPGSLNPTRAPTSSIFQGKKPTIITFQVPGNVINDILADEDKHPRVACNYWASRWGDTVAACWEEDKEKPGSVVSLEAAQEQRDAIVRWNRDNGGLISATNPPKESRAERPNDDRLLSGYTQSGWRYEVRKTRDGKVYATKKQIN